jgi:feruloyl esterase
VVGDPFFDDRRRRVQRTMPLCPFPIQARYTERGDVNRASSWSCAPNQDLLHVGADGARAGLLDPERPVR